MKKVFIIIFTVAMISAAFSKGKLFNTEEDTKIFSKKIMQLIFENKTGEAFDLLKKTWLIPDKEIMKLKAATVDNLNLISSRYGKMTGFQYIRTNRGSDIVVRHMYVIKHENHLTRWLFTFYKPRKMWILNSFKWDDKIQKVIK